MSADPRPANLLPRAQALQSRIDQQLGQSAALLVPAGVRSAVRELGALVALLAATVDNLTERQTRDR